MSHVPAPRPIDHLVLASRNLSAQAVAYRQMGFTVGAKNRHPWGTENHIVQFADTFLELISTGADFVAPQDPDPHSPGFAGFIQSYLARHEGFAMLALRTADATADAATYKSAGAGDFHPFHFGRKGKKPDGSEMEVAFTLAFAQSKLIADAGFFACQHHFPGNFWNPDFQTHANAATGVSSVIMVAENPSDHAEFLSHFTGQREMLATSMGLELQLAPGQKMEVLTPLAFAFHFGEEAKPADITKPHFAAARITVADLDRTAHCLREGGIAHAARGGLLVVPAHAAAGTALVFAP